MNDTTRQVTIRIIGLKARFTYVLTPKHSTHAYLKASIINDSERYTFLAGEMNVFMDGNFVSKSAIKVRTLLLAPLPASSFSSWCAHEIASTRVRSRSRRPSRSFCTSAWTTRSR
jgi:hypothetical protein